MSKVTAGL